MFLLLLNVMFDENLKARRKTKTRTTTVQTTLTFLHFMNDRQFAISICKLLTKKNSSTGRTMELTC